MFKKNLRNNLFKFEGDTGSNGGSDPINTEEVSPQINLEELSDEQLKVIKKKYGFVDNDEVDNIIKNKKQRWEQDVERAKLSEDERKKVEEEELRANYQKLLAEQERRNRSDAAITMLSKAQMPVSQDILNLVVRDSDEETQEQVNVLSQFYTKGTLEAANAVRDEVKNGAYPSFKKPSSTGLTKADIMAIEDDTKRIQAIAENSHLF
ncbi:DUF4355 domain-containing protein [Vagococcus sp. DIV0080]|uniref:DUF4355 domain-containing protein n=1 Tax=Candidatus Vagococcus giribetii TaxID=2230876 RepID=A0ABS3HVT6_9ENTE|nr:DUF4355 domain-containing protein [Vagococcus sp. DIV0080]